MIELTADVAVVGGGPAGASAAIRLAADGLDVVLVHDGRRVEHHLQTLAWAAVRLLGELGLDDLPACVASRVRSSLVTWADPDAVPQRVDRLVVDRDALDPALRALAVRSGARLVLGRADALSSDPDHCDPDHVVPVSTAAGTVLVRATAVVVATGRARRFVRGRRPLTPPTVALIGWVPVASLPAELCTSVVSDGWIWAVEHGRGALVVASTDPLAKSGQAERLVTMLAESGLVAAASMSSLQLEAVTTAGASWAAERSPAGVHLVGDAAIAFDPLSGQGLGAAIRSAVQVADDMVARGPAIAVTRPARPVTQIVADHRRALAAHYSAAAPRIAGDFWRARDRSGMFGVRGGGRRTDLGEVGIGA